MLVLLIHAPSLVILSSQEFLCSENPSVEWGLDLGLEPFFLVTWGVVALKPLFKVVQGLPVQDIALMIVMLECGVTVLMIQVRGWDYMYPLYHTTKLNYIWKPVSPFLSVAITTSTITKPSARQLSCQSKTYSARMKPYKVRGEFSEPICADTGRNGISSAAKALLLPATTTILCTAPHV